MTEETENNNILPTTPDLSLSPSDDYIYHFAERMTLVDYAQMRAKTAKEAGEEEVPANPYAESLTPKEIDHIGRTVRKQIIEKFFSDRIPGNRGRGQLTCWLKDAKTIQIADCFELRSGKLIPLSCCNKVKEEILSVIRSLGLIAPDDLIVRPGAVAGFIVVYMTLSLAI